MTSTSPVQLILKQIEVWRERLAIAVYAHNPHLHRQDLSVAIQTIINGLVFLRLCEGRNLEPDGQLQELIQHRQVYKRLYGLFQQVGDRYSSNFFQIELNLTIPDESFQPIISTLYHPDYPFEHSELPIELLAQMYERFLGKKIQVETKGKAIVNQVSKIRKAGGVYYTPTYIVDYIIENTIGVLLKKKTPQQAVSLRILDPACGAGIFLVRAYQYLLNWYCEQYSLDLEIHKNQLYQDKQGWRLALDTKKRILFNHIYGVDIDRHAIEVTKLSLWLILLEGESQDINFRSSLRINLNKTIKCGNALIRSDFFESPKNTLSNLRESVEINPFDWEQEFPEIMQSGGFDVIVGNPPWVFTRDVEFGKSVKHYFQRKYLSDIETTQQGKTKQTGKINLFAIFVFQFIKLLKKEGLTGIIAPNTILRTTVYDVVRKYILDRCNIDRIVDLGSGVFEGVTASPVILILGKEPTHKTVKFFKTINLNPTLLNKDLFLNTTSYVFSVFLDKSQDSLFQKMEACSIKLTNVAREIIEGIVCRKDQIFNKKIDARYKRLLAGKDIDRYSISFKDTYILFDRARIHRPRPDFIWQAKEKIILRRIGGSKFSLVAVLDTENYYTFASTNNILLKDNTAYNIKYILALLNSKLINYYYTQKFTNQSELTVNISKTFVEQLPIRAIDFTNCADKASHDRLVRLVEDMLCLQNSDPN
ncbi:MAG: N-6 DNA methylase [Cyanobacteria bacterium RU_5_0]|nr:N-6 DNA methylase [Cyanobacteria bacterium RU_5_0]